MNFPAGDFIEQDDAAAKAIAIHLNLLDELNKESFSTRNGAVAICTYHPTHWVLIGRFREFSRHDENGFVAVGLPKSKYSPEDFLSTAHLAMTALFGEAPDLRTKIVDARPGSS